MQQVQGIGAEEREFLTMPFAFEGDEMVWAVGHEAENDVQRITELVRPPETVENWTELVTLQTYNKAAADWGTRDEHLDAHREELTTRCPGSTISVIPHDEALLYEGQTTNCPEGADEQILGRVFDGNDNRFIVQYSVRGTQEMTPQRRDEWIANLLDSRIVRFETN